MTRTLVLRREHLAPLSDTELGAVAAGQAAPPSRDCPDNTYYCILTGERYCGVETLLECV